MIELNKTTTQNPDFLKLVSKLDKELANRTGDNNDFFAQFNKVDLIQHVMEYDDLTAVGCGAIKHLMNTPWKSKECMFLLPIVDKGLQAKFCAH